MTSDNHESAARGERAKRRRPREGSTANSITEGTGGTFKPLDYRGKLHRASRKMTDADSQKFLKEQRVVHVGTKDANGWPYVIPLVYVYEGGDLFYFHTGSHRGISRAMSGTIPAFALRYRASGRHTKVNLTPATLRWSTRAS